MTVPAAGLLGLAVSAAARFFGCAMPACTVATFSVSTLCRGALSVAAAAVRVTMSSTMSMRIFALRRSLGRSFCSIPFLGIGSDIVVADAFVQRRFELLIEFIHGEDFDARVQRSEMLVPRALAVRFGRAILCQADARTLDSIGHEKLVG